MKETIELSPSILDYLNQEPEERKYCRSGYEMVSDYYWDGETMGFFDSEKSARMERERVTQDHRYQRVTDAPYEITRQQATDFARSYGARTVQIFDEQRQIVEEWTV